MKMDGIGGLAGWRWIFILEGLATVVLGLIAAKCLPADIASAKFFTEEERQFARKTLLPFYKRRLLIERDSITVAHHRLSTDYLSQYSIVIGTFRQD